MAISQLVQPSCAGWIWKGQRPKEGDQLKAISKKITWGYRLFANYSHTQKYLPSASLINENTFNLVLDIWDLKRYLFISFEIRWFKMAKINK